MRSNRAGVRRRASSPRFTLVMLLAVLTLGCFLGPTASAAPWSAPVKIYTPETFGYDLIGVSCATESSCVAIDNENDAMTWNGSTWSGQVTVTGTTGIQPREVSCALASFCVVGDTGGRVTVYNGSSWSSPATVAKSGSYSISGLSCPSAVHCGALDSQGYATLFNGSTWSEPVQALFSVTGVSRSMACTTLPSFFCLATGKNSYVASYNGSTWSGWTRIYGAAGLNSSSCSSSTECMVVSNEGDAFQYDDGSWSRTEVSNSSLDSVSCVPNSLPMVCAAVGFGNNVYMFDGTNWNTFAGVDSNGHIASVSCPTRTYCKAVDEDGYEVTYNGPPEPENIKPPAISGSAVEGQTLNELHGEWLHAPTLYSYYWSRCDSEGLNCESVAEETSSYTLTAADVGHTIRVIEEAGNFTGFGLPATSPPTAVVQAKPEPEDNDQPGDNSGGGGSSSNDGSNGGTDEIGPPLPPAVRCVVPQLRGKTLKRAKRLLKRRHCRLGKVRVVRSRRHRGRRHRRHYAQYYKRRRGNHRGRRNKRRKLRVIRQNPRPGKVRPRGFRVSVLVRRK